MEARFNPEEYHEFQHPHLLDEPCVAAEPADLRSDGHQLLLNAEPGRLSLKCMSCPYETPGWTIKEKSPPSGCDGRRPACSSNNAFRVSAFLDTLKPRFARLHPRMSGETKALVRGHRGAPRRRSRVECRRLRTAAGGAGYRVARAKNGYEALAEVSREAPSLVLLDLKLPNSTAGNCCSG